MNTNWHTDTFYNHSARSNKQDKWSKLVVISLDWTE